jgi:hyperosmotically inducible protein
MSRTILTKFMIAAAVLGLSIAAAATNDTVSASDAAIIKKLTHEIRMYPRYSIFDNIGFFVDEGRVELLGEVSEPFKKSELGRIAQRVPGVASLSNELKVLPLSPMDNRLRLQVARAIYRDPVLSGYSFQPVPPIHIIVDNGHVTLEGVVRTDMEKNVAGLRAAGAGLSFGQITSNLHVETRATKFERASVTRASEVAPRRPRNARHNGAPVPAAGLDPQCRCGRVCPSFLPECG